MLRPVAALWFLLAAAGCQDKPCESAEDAYVRLGMAVNKGDAARVFDDLDTPTQWSIESVQHAQRQMKQLILEAYPVDEQARALARIPPAAEEDEEHPRRYFRRLEGVDEIVADVKHRMHVGQGQPVGSVDDRTRSATVWRAGGSIFRFAADKDSRWGWSELREQWENAKVRATHDLETVQQNAALYRGQKPPPREATHTG